MHVEFKIAGGTTIVAPVDSLTIWEQEVAPGKDLVGLFCKGSKVYAISILLNGINMGLIDDKTRNFIRSKMQSFSAPINSGLEGLAQK